MQFSFIKLQKLEYKKKQEVMKRKIYNNLCDIFDAILHFQQVWFKLIFKLIFIYRLIYTVFFNHSRLQFLLSTSYQHRHFLYGEVSLNLRDAAAAYPMHRGISDTRGWGMQICSFSGTSERDSNSRHYSSDMRAHTPRGYKCTWTRRQAGLDFRWRFNARPRKVVLPIEEKAHARMREHRQILREKSKRIENAEDEERGRTITQKGACRTSRTWQLHRPCRYSLTVTSCTFDSGVSGCAFVSFAPSSRQVLLTSI